MKKIKSALKTLSLFALTGIGFIGTTYYAIKISIEAVGLMDYYGLSVPKEEITLIITQSLPFFLIYLAITGFSLSKLQKSK